MNNLLLYKNVPETRNRSRAELMFACGNSIQQLWLTCCRYQTWSEPYVASCSTAILPSAPRRFVAFTAWISQAAELSGTLSGACGQPYTPAATKTCGQTRPVHYAPTVKLLTHSRRSISSWKTSTDVTKMSINVPRGAYVSHGP